MKTHTQPKTQDTQTTVYQIREVGTNALIGTYKNLKRANNKRDKLDNAYGGYHYTVKRVTQPKTQDAQPKAIQDRIKENARETFSIEIESIKSQLKGLQIEIARAEENESFCLGYVNEKVTKIQKYAGNIKKAFEELQKLKGGQ